MQSLESGLSSASTLVIGIAREAKLGDHQIGEAEWHGAVDLCQSVQTVGPLKEVLRTMPHTLVSTAGVLLQVAEVNGFDKNPGGFVNASYGLEAFLQILRHGKVHGDIIAVLCLVNQGVHRLRLVLEELQVAVVKKSSSD